jgi:hypothetical protein
MVHHIQTKRLIYLQQCRNSIQKHKKSNICITKKTTKQKLCLKIPNHQKWFDIAQDGIISHNKYLESIHA